MIRVLVNGAKGRMGQETVKAVSDDPALELVGQTDLGDDLLKSIETSKAEVVVDFTPASVGYENALKIIEAGVCPVIGTSGFVQEQVRELQKLCAEKKLGGLIAPNFAVGAVLMMKFSREAAKYFPRVEVIEAHHDAKKDSPSGTALRTAEMMAETREQLASLLMEKEIVPGARGAEFKGIPIHSLRLPGVVANQSVVFGGVGQTLTVEHNSLNRESFMPGVCLACKKVVEMEELCYGLETIL